MRGLEAGDPQVRIRRHPVRLAAPTQHVGRIGGSLVVIGALHEDPA